MNSILKAKEVFCLKELIEYKENGINIVELASTKDMVFKLLAFDEGAYLSEHTAPGNAVVFGLEGRGVINYEGTDYEISAGQNFRFEKDGLHSVKAKGRFKMALLLVME